MRLTIDNLDGLGAVDYTAAIDCSEPLAIERTLNAPSILKGLLCLAASALAIPARRGRIIVTSDAGTTLFTGYLATEPAPVYAGEASQGAVYRYALSAVSDEWLLDKQSLGFLFGPGIGTGSGSLLAALANRLAEGALATSEIAPGETLGVFQPVAGGSWSAQAGTVANAAYSAYRAVAGSLGLGRINSVQHGFSDGDGSLIVAALKTASVSELANDVTVTGTEEPCAYWTELFAGDGATAVFNLLGQTTAPGAGKASLLADPFNESVINLQTWQIADPGSHLSLTGAGLTCTGGNGLDGQTTLIAWNPLELGGTLVFELGSAMLAAGSTGVIGGLYSGIPVQANCLAGFNIRQNSGQTLATPMVQGVEVGTSLTVLPGHAYTLRIRLHCPEMLRVQQTFYALVNGSGGDEIRQFGAGDSLDPLALVFEARDEGLATNTRRHARLLTGPGHRRPRQQPQPDRLHRVDRSRLNRLLLDPQHQLVGNPVDPPRRQACRRRRLLRHVVRLRPRHVLQRPRPRRRRDRRCQLSRPPARRCPRRRPNLARRRSRRRCNRQRPLAGPHRPAARPLPAGLRDRGPGHPQLRVESRGGPQRQLPGNHPPRRRYMARRHPQPHHQRRHPLGHRPPCHRLHPGRVARDPHLPHRLRQRLGRRHRPQALRNRRE